MPRHHLYLPLEPWKNDDKLSQGFIEHVVTDTSEEFLMDPSRSIKCETSFQVTETFELLHKIIFINLG